ncbi:MAG: SDR family NAD(P)-dependent oxidoreductase [Solirubrobacteraceae bacterium]
MDLTGATCLLTGANRGIGLALAHRLAREPLATLLLGTRSPSQMPPVAAPEGGAAEIRAVRLDLSSRASIDDSWRELGDPPIDLLINNAGQMTGGLLEEQDIERMYAMLQVNLVAVAHLTARVLPGMLERARGKIVNNASISGYAHFPAATTYAASKAGVVALTESLRRELEGTGVETLHLITPGVNTEMLDDTEAVYGRYMDTSGWEREEPGAWAEKVIAAIRSDERKLEPGGKIGWAVRASRGPTALLDMASRRMFSREPRR